MKYLIYFLLSTLIAYLGYQLFLSEDISNKSMVPKNSEYVAILRIENIIPEFIMQSENLLSTGIFDKLFELEEKRNELTHGIQLKHDIIAYTIHDNDIEYLGIVLNLSSPKDFLNNIQQEFQTETTGVATNGAVGLVIFPISDSNSTDLNSIAERLIHLEREKYTSKSDFSNKTSFASIYSKDIDNSFNHSVNLEFIDNRIEIKGDIKVKNIKNQNYQSIEKEGLSFHTNYLLNYSPEFITKGLLGKNVELNSIALNIRGIDLTTNEILPFTPNFDIVIGAKPGDFDEKLRTYHKSILEGCETTFYSQMINDSTYYIGTTKNPKFITTNDIIGIHGNLDFIGNLNGNRFAKKLIQIFPIYQKTLSASENTNLIDFKLTTKEENIVNVQGIYEFKGTKTALVQFAVLFSAFIDE